MLLIKSEKKLIKFKTKLKPMESRRDDALVATKGASLRDFILWVMDRV
jgi:hypothetical protein